MSVSEVAELMIEDRPSKWTCVKTKVKDNKQLIIGLGVGLAVGAIGTYFLKPNVKASIDNAQILSWKPINNSVNEIITVLARRGHPGWIIRCKETGEVFASQNRAAEVMGISKGVLSGHLNGKLDNAAGYTFERIQEAM